VSENVRSQPPPRLTSRSRLRLKSQLTMPEEIRRALQVAEGDEVEFTVHENGTVTVRGYVSVPADQIRDVMGRGRTGDVQLRSSAQGRPVARYLANLAQLGATRLKRNTTAIQRVRRPSATLCTPGTKPG
jgi:bifunctional DNA-binding transcriptional regulator/antitoxin component of YhaV-PrlF toxin-antitoxin module